ncbi:hypothetical protein RI129_003514 [Pyrocoelia pectoralis]|uniref:Molybdopterin synthase sulfur carrier subunit n=1 Tax=Pyrocoelia pectoralis TaxID=417401 RepID=A0AAN7ZN45_9COLE
MNIEIEILFFAKARELSGKNQAIISVSSIISFEDLLSVIVQEFDLDAIKHCCMLSVNEEYVNFEDTLHLKQGDIVAIIPPISGG